MSWFVNLLLVDFPTSVGEYFSKISIPFKDVIWPMIVIIGFWLIVLLVGIALIALIMYGSCPKLLLQQESCCPAGYFCTILVVLLWVVCWISCCWMVDLYLGSPCCIGASVLFFAGSVFLTSLLEHAGESNQRCETNPKDEQPEAKPESE